jgi:hypothetical protein
MIVLVDKIEERDANLDYGTAVCAVVTVALMGGVTAEIKTYGTRYTDTDGGRARAFAEQKYMLIAACRGAGINVLPNAEAQRLLSSAYDAMNRGFLEDADALCRRVRAMAGPDVPGIIELETAVRNRQWEKENGL